MESQDLEVVISQDVHEDDRPHKCDRCFSAFKKLCQLSQHQVHAHGKRSRYAQCDKSFKREATLSAHKKNAHDTERSFQCEMCSKTYTLKSSLRWHYKYSHRESRPYKCDHCSESFGAVSTLNYHLRHKHKEGGKFSCNLCPRNFYTQYLLKRHLRSHSTETDFKCYSCKKNYTSKEAFVQHLKDELAVKKPFECEKRRSIKEHTVQNTNKTDVQCEQFDQTYKVEWDHLYHKPYVPTSEKHFTCKECPKSFALFPKEHSVKHNEEAPLKYKTSVDEHVKEIKMEVEGAEMFDDVKVEPVTIYDSEMNQVVLDIKKEFEDDTDIYVKQESEEIDES